MWCCVLFLPCMYIWRVFSPICCWRWTPCDVTFFKSPKLSGDSTLELTFLLLNGRKSAPVCVDIPVDCPFSWKHKVSFESLGNQNVFFALHSGADWGVVAHIIQNDIQTMQQGLLGKIWTINLVANSRNNLSGHQLV